MGVSEESRPLLCWLKSHVYELRAPYSTAKMPNSFTRELPDPPLQNWWHQAEDAFHWGPFQQSLSKARTRHQCHQRLESGLVSESSPAVGKGVERGLVPEELQ